jgi:hypothetical protein
LTQRNDGDDQDNDAERSQKAADYALNSSPPRGNGRNVNH